MWQTVKGRLGDADDQALSWFPVVTSVSPCPLPYRAI